MAAPSTIPSSTVPAWATNAGTRDPVPLPSGLQGTGWVPGTVLPALTGNALWGPLADWCAYLQASAPGAGQWDMTKIAIYYTSTQHGQISTALDGGVRYFTVQALAASTGLLVGTTGGTGQAHIRFTDADDTITGLDLVSGDEHWSSTSVAGFLAPRASAPGGSGTRWSYPASNPNEVTWTITGPDGGWTFSQNPAAHYWYRDGNEYWRLFNLTGGAIDATTRHSLAHMIHDNVEWSGTVLTLVDLTAELDCLGTGQDVTVSVMQRTRSSPTTITPIASVTLGSTGSSTQSWSGSVALDTNTYDYFVEAEVLQAGAGTAGSAIRIVSLTLTKTAVE